MRVVWLVCIFVVSSVCGQIRLSGFTIIENHLYYGSIYKDSQQDSILKCALECATLGSNYPVLEYSTSTLTCRIFQYQAGPFINLTPTTLVNTLAVLDGFTAVTKELQVSNGLAIGVWGNHEFCVPGSFASGYTMKIELWQGEGDDSSLNAVSLQCSNRYTGTNTGTITSATAPWGDWNNPTYCPASSKLMFLKAFSQQVMPDMGNLDDTGGNFIKFHCRDTLDQLPNQEVSQPPGNGFWGVWGEWSMACNPGSAICGLRTRIYADTAVDKTGFNDVILYCCIN